MSPEDELIFLPLGGSGEIGMNVNLYGCRGKWIMCDLGMTFADPSLPGADLVLPDLQFIEDRRDDLLGIVLTHGHEDHIGAIPYLVDTLRAPLYATPFTAGLIHHKLVEAGLEDEVELNVVPLGGEVQLKPFHLKYVALAHSIPEGNALVIDTPHGRLFHTGDWKLDDRPMMGQPVNEQQLRKIGANDGQGTLALIGDSTNVFNEQLSGSEASVREGLMQVVRARHTGRVVVTTFASNAMRLKIIGDVARACGRRLVTAGRALDRIIQIAKDCGYLTDFPETVSWDEAMKMPPEKILVMATGTQGEPRAALARMAEGNHPIRLSEGDLVIFSSRQIPGNELKIGRVQNALAARGIDIITDSQARVHVSGHPGRPALRAIFDWIQPQMVIPVHGERRHMEEHARLALESGVPQAMVPVNGMAIRLAPDGPAQVSTEQAGRLVVDGDIILPADGSTMGDRRKMAWGGHLAVTVVLGRSTRDLLAPVGVIASGIAIEGEEDQFRAEVAEAAETVLAERGKDSDAQLQEKIRIATRRVANQWTGKKPLTHVEILRRGGGS